MERRNAVYINHFQMVRFLFRVFDIRYLWVDISKARAMISKTIADSTDVASKGSIGTRRMLFCLGQRKSSYGVL